MTTFKSEQSRQIAEILADLDIMKLGEGNPHLISEYKPEADEIAQRLSEMRTHGVEIDESAFSEMVKQVFEYWFSETIASSDADEVTRQVIVKVQD
jgi:hypothetical protein